MVLLHVRTCCHLAAHPLPQLAKNTDELLLLENLHKVMDMYLWLGVNCGQAMFPSYPEVAQQRLALADLISASVEALPAAQRSRNSASKKTLPPGSRKTSS
jgi:hypothetical protein